MKIKYLVILSLLIIAITAFAADVQYPVEELGGCGNKEDCKNYCDKPANTSACLDFALKTNLMSEQEVLQAKKFLAADDTPGDCKNKEKCDAYCNNIDPIDECISFAEKNGLIPEE